MIQIGRQGLINDGAEVAELRAQFDAEHYFKLPRLLEPSLLDFLQQRLALGAWKTYVHNGIGEEYVLDDPPALSLLDFVTNVGSFRELIEALTGCGPLRRFDGRIYRMIAALGHHDSWHDDRNIAARQVAMSLNLSGAQFRGGRFLLREKPSGRMLADVANTGLGDAVIFRIARGLEHRISEVEGDAPKTAFAGWFLSAGTELWEEVREHPGKPAGSAE